MVTYFNKKDLTEFGNYLLSEKREENLKPEHKENLKRKVTHADFENWLELKK